MDPPVKPEGGRSFGGGRATSRPLSLRLDRRAHLTFDTHQGSRQHPHAGVPLRIPMPSAPSQGGSGSAGGLPTRPGRSITSWGSPQTLPREVASVPAGTGGTGVTRFASAAALLPVIRTLEPHAYPPGRSDFMRRAEPSPPGRHSVRYPLRQIRECASSTFPRNRTTPPARYSRPRPGPAGPGALATGDALIIRHVRQPGIRHRHFFALTDLCS